MLDENIKHVLQDEMNSYDGDRTAAAKALMEFYHQQRVDNLRKDLFGV